MTNVDGASLMVAAELEGAGAHINGVAAGLADELKSLAAALQPISETWTGTASANYEILQQEWNYAAMGLFGPDGVLGEIAQAMNVNWGNYADAEWSNSQSWQQVG